MAVRQSFDSSCADFGADEIVGLDLPGGIPLEAGLLRDIDWHLWQLEAYTSVMARSEWPGAPASEVSLQRMLE